MRWPFCRDSILQDGSEGEMCVDGLVVLAEVVKDKEVVGGEEEMKCIAFGTVEDMRG